MGLKQQVKNLWQSMSNVVKDENFLTTIGKIENFVSKILAIALIIVIFASLFDLLKVLTYDLFVSEPRGSFSVPLLKVFGMFLNVLIALELMENVTAYLRQHVIQLELIIITALTAVARKIVIFDTQSDGDLTGLSIAVLSLSISYWIVRSQNQSRKH